MQKRSKKYEIDMCNGPILMKMLAFALPLMCSSVLQLLFNAVDIIVVGRFAGDHSLAAVGSTTSLINLFVRFFIGLSIGVNVLVSRYCAAKRDKQVSETVHTAMFVAGISGIILTIIGIFVTPIMLRLMDTPKEILHLAIGYTRTYFCGITATLVYNFGAAILRSIGDTKRPMFYLIFAGVINVVFNLFFVVVLHWDVYGVGIATAISQTVSALLVVRCLMKEQSGIRLELKKIHFYKDKFLDILQIGLPAGIQSTLFNVANVTVQSSINQFGATVVAGSSASSNIGQFISATVESFMQAALTFTSQNVGARKYHRINRVLITSLSCAVVTGLVVGVGAYLAGPWLLAIYTDSSAVIEAGLVKLRIVGTTYALLGMMNVIVGVLRGMGYAVVPMIVSLIGSCALRIAILQTVFRIPRFHNIETVYWVYPISWAVTAMDHAVTYIIIKRKMKKEVES